MDKRDMKGHWGHQGQQHAHGKGDETAQDSLVLLSDANGHQTHRGNFWQILENYRRQKYQNVTCQNTCATIYVISPTGLKTGFQYHFVKEI